MGHYFENERIGEYGCIMGRTLNGASSFALVFKSAEEVLPNGTLRLLSSIKPVAMDTAGHYDTIELHHLRRGGHEPTTLRAGSRYTMRYYILMSHENGYGWIANLVRVLEELGG